MSEMDLRLAREFPRDERAVDAMRASCGRMAMAERAFWSMVRDGEVVTGPSVVLARELARCWGNVLFGVREVGHRSGETDVEAWAWDLESNTRASFEFVVRHSGRTARDVIAAQGARRVREAILQVLPPWLTEEATALCHRTLVEGDGIPLHLRRDAVVALWAEMNVRAATLEPLVGRPWSDWTPLDIATLHVRAVSVQRGEVSVAEVFGQADTSSGSSQRVTADEILKNAGGAEADPSVSGDGGLAVADPDNPPASIAGEGDDGAVLAASEPSPATVGDPGFDGAPGSPDVVVETERAAAPPSPPPSPPPADVDADTPVSDETRARAKKAKVAARDAGNAKALIAQLRAEGVSAQESNWTELSARKLIEIAEGLS